MVSGTHRHLIDYLGDEVMAGLDVELRELLSAAAVTERFTTGLLAAMTGIADAAALLDRAERSNLFLAPLDGEGHWFRMHGLFADYLRSRLPADERRRLHAAAAAWLDAAGMGREALAQAFEADDPVLATRLVGREGRAAFEAGELRTLERWIAALPPGARESDLEIASLEAWSRFYTGDLAGGAAVAARATATPGDPSTARGRLLVLLALVGTTMRPDAESLARDGIEQVGDDDLFRSLGLQAAGLAQLARGDVAASLETLRAAFDAAEASGLPIAVLPAVNPLGHALVATGRRDEAELVARRVLAAHPGPGGEPLAVAWPARLTLGIALFEGGDVVEARGELERGLAAAESLGVGREVLGWALPAIALARQATGDARGALAILERGPAPAMAFPSLAGETEARVRLAQGDLAWASRWADEALHRGARGVAAARDAPRLGGHDRGQSQARPGPARGGATGPGARPRDLRGLGHRARPDLGHPPHRVRGPRLGRSRDGARRPVARGPPGGTRRLRPALRRRRPLAAAPAGRCRRGAGLRDEGARRGAR